MPFRGGSCRATTPSGANPDAISCVRSDDPSELESANTMLSMLSEGVSEGDIVAAFAGGLWDAFYEPNTVTDQDVKSLFSKPGSATRITLWGRTAPKSFVNSSDAGRPAVIGSAQ